MCSTYAILFCKQTVCVLIIEFIYDISADIVKIRYFNSQTKTSYRIIDPRPTYLFCFCINFFRQKNLFFEIIIELHNKPVFAQSAYTLLLFIHSVFNKLFMRQSCFALISWCESKMKTVVFINLNNSNIWNIYLMVGYQVHYYTANTSLFLILLQVL